MNDCSICIVLLVSCRLQLLPVYDLRDSTQPAAFAMYIMGVILDLSSRRRSVSLAGSLSTATAAAVLVGWLDPSNVTQCAYVVVGVCVMD